MGGSKIQIPRFGTHSFSKIGFVPGTSGQTETNTCVTGNTFKERFNGHKSDIRHEKNRHNTSLADHVWKLKKEGKDYNIEWRLVDRAPPFNPITRKCRVCLKEKCEILYNQAGSTLNKRNEIFNTCRHRVKRLLMNVKTWDPQLPFRFRNTNSYAYFMLYFVIPEDLSESYVKQICRITNI